MMVEKLADVSDAATQLQDQSNEQALLARRRAEDQRVAAAGRAKSSGDWDGCSCLKCGEGLPPERIADWRMVCTPCQTVIEKQDKMRRN